jgi:hypothetical protein
MLGHVESSIHIARINRHIQVLHSTMLVAVNFSSNPIHLQKLHEQIEAHLGTAINRINLSLNPTKFTKQLAKTEIITTYHFSTKQFLQSCKLQ